MSGVRSHPMALAGLSAVAAGTTLVSLLTWQGFTEEFGRTLGPLFVLAIVVAGTGAVAPLVAGAAGAARRWPRCCWWGWSSARSSAGRRCPIGEAWDRLITAFTDAVAEREPVRAAGALPTNRPCTRC